MLFFIQSSAPLLLRPTTFLGPYHSRTPSFLLPRVSTRSLIRIRTACEYHPAGSQQSHQDQLSTSSTPSPPSPTSLQQADAVATPIPSQFGSNNVPRGPDDGSGGEGGGEGGGDGGQRLGTLQSWLRERSLALEAVDPEVVQAFLSGRIGLDVLANWLHAQGNFVGRLMMRIGGGLKGRLLADRLFLLKVAIEEGIGVCGKLSAEFERRRERFWREGEFVFANLLMAVLADFALVYFPAPSVALRTGAGPQGAWTSGLTAWASGLPSNVFQTDRPFTLVQRSSGFFLKAGQLFAVGFACCLLSAALTNVLMVVRERLDPGYKPQVEKSRLLSVSAMYATFLAVSSGTRYQLVNGIESHIFPRLFGNAPRMVEEVSTFLLRFANTFEGSRQWVKWAQFTGVQKSTAEG